jgi:hypothetical protein
MPQPDENVDPKRLLNLLIIDNPNISARDLQARNLSGRILFPSISSPMPAEISSTI